MIVLCWIWNYESKPRIIDSDMSCNTDSDTEVKFHWPNWFMHYEIDSLPLNLG